MLRSRSLSGRSMARENREREQSYRRFFGGKTPLQSFKRGHQSLLPALLPNPYDGSAIALSLQEAMAAVDAFACRELAHAPVPVLDEIFSGQVFSDGSVADIIHKAGGFNFLADLHRQKRLFSIRDDDLPTCLLYTSPSPRDLSTSRMPSSA